jgi:hypothetical protein
VAVPGSRANPITAIEVKQRRLRRSMMSLL